MISKLNFCSSVLTVDGKESLRKRAERGIVLEKHCVKLYTCLSFIITLQRIFEVFFVCVLLLRSEMSDFIAAFKSDDTCNKL